MQHIIGDLTKDVTDGIIIQQVNCMGAYGAGLSGVLARKWRSVETAYRSLCAQYANNREDLLGMQQEVDVNGDGSIVVVNSFSEYDFGNAYTTGKCYTHMSLLVNAVNEQCKKAKEQERTVYIPKLLGCGLAGGNWEELVAQIEHNDNLVVVELP